MSLPDAIRDFFRRERCVKLVEYTAYRLAIKNIDTNVPPLEVKVGQIKVGREVLQLAGEAALALDDCQYQLCLRIKSMRSNDPLRPHLIELWTHVLLWITAVRLALAAFAHDPNREGRNLRKTVEEVNRKLLDAPVAAPREAPEAQAFAAVRAPSGVRPDIIPVRLPQDLLDVSIAPSGVVRSLTGVRQQDLRALLRDLQSE